MERVLYFSVFNPDMGDRTEPGTKLYNLFFECVESKAGAIMVEGLKRGCIIMETTTVHIEQALRDYTDAVRFVVTEGTLTFPEVYYRTTYRVK